MTSRSPAALLVAGLALVCAAPSSTSLAAPAAASSAVPHRFPNDPTWPQARSDVRPDPAVRFGALPNGMRYALVHSETPKGEASLRLWFDAGSLDETDPEQGLAHFLEHMAFNGSTHVPEGEMIKTLQRLGLAFGADTNASTSWSETIYQLDLPSTADATVDTGLMLMRETAGELTLSQGAIGRERGVVLSEERSREGPGLRVARQSLDFLLQGQLAARRLPIGKPPVIEGATSEQLKSFYARYYRPERAVLVAVGDFDVAAMEKKIRDRFSDWKGAGQPGAEPDLGLPVKRGLQTRVAVEPGASMSLQVAWVRPPDETPDSIAERRKDMIEQLALAVLNRRLSSIARGGQPPFIAAGAYQNDQFHSAEMTTLQVTTDPARWRASLSAAAIEQRRLVQFGVTQAELDREITEWRSALRAQAAGVATRTTQGLADAIVGTFDDREVFTSPVQDLSLFEETAKSLKAETVSAAARRLFEGQGPLVFLASPTAIEGGDAAVRAVWTQSQATPLRAAQAATVAPWPYTSFGTPGGVAETRQLADLGATLVRFDNGVRLTVRPNKYKADQILVRVRIGNGVLDLSATRPNALWASGAFPEGGLKKATAEQIDRMLSDRIYDANFAMGDDAFVLQGATRPADFLTQMQVLAAFTQDPAYRPEAFERFKTYAATLNDQMEATPGGVLSRDLTKLLHSGDARFGFPDKAQIAGTTPSQFAAELQPLLSRGQIEITVVGDISVDEAVKAAASTFGALPPRKGPDLDPSSRTSRFPAPTPTPVVLYHKGRADQSSAFMAWRGPDFFSDPQEARTLRVLSAVMEQRLLDELREAQGVTYSPSANANNSLVFTGYGYIAAAVEVPPDKLDDFFSSTTKIAADLASRPVTQDELDRAKKPLLEALDKARQGNEYWLEQLSGAQGEPRKFDAIRSVVPSISRVTPADLQKAAQRWLTPDGAYKLEVVPASHPEKAVAG